MKKHMILVVLLVFAALANPMQAQEAGTSLQWEIDSLMTVIKAQDKVIKDKENKLKGSREIKLLQERINSYNKEKIPYWRDNVVKVQHDIDSVRGLLAVMRRPCDSLAAVNTNLERYKTQVKPLVSRQLSQMANSVDKTWLGMTYAEIDMTSLSEELKLYEDFQEQDKGVAKAYKTLSAFGKDVMLYNQGVEIVNSPYDSDRIAAIIQPFENLVDKERHAGRKAESTVVLGQLKDYSVCLQRFQKDIIEPVDGMLESYKRDGTSKKAWKQLRSFLDSADGSMAVNKLSQIPWLEKQYNLYVRQLEVNPYAPNPARETIIHLVP